MLVERPKEHTQDRARFFDVGHLGLSVVNSPKWSALGSFVTSERFAHMTAVSSKAVVANIGAQFRFADEAAVDEDQGN